MTVKARNPNSTGKMKENNGHAARRQLLRKLGIVLCVFCILMGALVLADKRYTEEGQSHGGNRQSLFNKLRRASKTNVKRPPVSTEFSQILEAKLHLIDIDVNGRELTRSPPDSYEGIYGSFCEINFQAHKDDPSSSKYKVDAGILSQSNCQY